MRNARLWAVVIACVATLALAPLASAQMSVERVNAIDAQLQRIKAVYDKMPATQQKLLDGYTNVLRLADAWHQYGMRLTEASMQQRLSLLKETGLALPNTLPGSVVAVSNPSNDTAFSAFAGFTQSETSTARCGNSVVVGFNDSGSVFETGFFSGGALSFSGWGVSSDGGATFTDGGPFPPGPAPNFVIGDPLTTCINSSTFYFAQLLFTADSAGNPLSAIALSKSTDGGHTWGNPVVAAAKDGFTHILDKDWSAVDPVHKNRVYVSYTDFDFSFTNPACPNNVRIAIELVFSNDGGATFHAPKPVFTVCGNSAVQGSQLAVDSKGVLHIAWVNLGDNFPFSARSIQVSTLLANGTFSAPVTATSITAPGDTFFLQGEFRDFLGMAMAVDRSGTATDGNLYLTWDDGRDKTVTDPFGVAGTYSYPDIFFTSSSNGGATWSTPVKVNSDTQPATGGHDHWQPGIAVDKTGTVAICWYDRRDDVENLAIERFCGTSTNAGINWGDTNLGTPAFAPTHGWDLFVNPVYMGDYDALTSDFTKANAGFIGAFQLQGNRGNPDVFAVSF